MCLCVCVAKPVAVELRCHVTALINTWFTDFFSKYEGRRREKNKKKITKNFFLFNLKHIWIGGKKNNKKFMILHCKYAEMTILLSFLHFYSVKSYNFCYFFLTFKKKN